jgi:glycosyltransferase involved in cell wall biosynthesis
MSCIRTDFNDNLFFNLLFLMTPSITVILITKNEILNLAECLISLSGFADEIVIVDNQSSDGTLEIAKQFNAKIIQTTSWPGFGPQKNIALSHASHEWVLSIDADERLTPELIQEMKSQLLNPQDVICFAIPRLSQYCGKFIHHSGWSPDYVDRLFKRGQARFSDHLVHERLLPDGKTKRLSNHLIHYSYRNFEQVINKVNQYSTLGAEQAFQNGKSSSVFAALYHGFWAFFRTYILRLGFLDGTYGFALAISNGQASYYKYIKLLHLNQQRK